jgi:hypothetical protein
LDVIAFIPAVVQQVRDVWEFEKEELILYKSSGILYNASIIGGNSLFGIVLSVGPSRS